MGSLQAAIGIRSAAMIESSCGYLLQELQMIWDEVGEERFERERVLLDLEQECIQVYRRKVDSANISRARLHQELAEAEAEFTHLLLSLDERSLPGRPDRMAGTLKEQVESITPALQELQLRKEERVKQFQLVQRQIQNISREIAGLSECEASLPGIVVNDNDLSIKKLEEYQAELQRLHSEKNNRLQKVENLLSSVQNLSGTLGMDYLTIIAKVHPSLNTLSGPSKNISDAILAKLDSTVKSLEEEKNKRLQKLHHLSKQLTNLWNLMDTPYEDRQLFCHIAGLLSVPLADTFSPGSLTLDTIQQAEAEVKRLDQVKASTMKELFLKKQLELKEICSRSHMEIPSQAEMDNISNLINSGEIDHADLLTSMDGQIFRAKEAASSRKIIMEKVEKWMTAREEERWLEEYDTDENRYSASRGAHKNLRRAERARVMVNKITASVDSLVAKTKEWEKQQKRVFLYDGVPLLAVLEEYNLLRQEKEKENQRQREKKKVQSPDRVEKENQLGLRPSTGNLRILNRSLNGGFKNATPVNTRHSLGIQQLGSNSMNSATQGISFTREAKKPNRQKINVPPGYGYHPKEDAASIVSTFSGPSSP